MLATMAPSMPGSYFERSPEDVSHQYTSSRKRPRLDSHNHSTPRSSDDPRLGASISSIDIASPSPLANTDYFLSGGLDTPGGWQNQCYETRETLEYEGDHRPSRFAQRPGPNRSPSPPATPPPHPTHNIDGQSHSISGWHLRQMAWAVTGGLAGKLFNFCWNTTFSGFAAGGGQAYGAPSRNQVDTRHILSPRPPGPNKDATSQDSVTKGSWVFVSQSLDTEDSESPLRKRPRPSIASAAPTPRPTLLNRPRTNSGSASFASPRSRTNSLTFTRHASRPSSSHVYPHKLPTTTTTTITPSSTSATSTARPKHPHPRPRPSTASPRRQSTYASPASPEIEQYKRQKKRAEKKQDESFRKLNAQLQDMIRQGQAALGSKVDICGDGDDMDEGYFEDFLD